MSILAGALGGLGQGLVSVGEQMREDAREKRKREQQLQDEARRNSEYDRRTSDARGYEQTQRDRTISRGAAALTGGKDLERAGYVKSRFVEMGYPDHVASGLVGNLMQESGAGLDTSAVGDGGNAFGMAQWNGPRRKAYMAYANEKGVDPSDLDTQIEYLDHEFKTTESSAYEAVMKTKTAEEAALVASEKFWRPGTPHNDRRMAYAKQLAEVIADPDQSPQVREAAAERFDALQGGPKKQKKLTGEEWVERDGKEVLMGRDDEGTMMPYKDSDGKPISRDPKKTDGKPPRSISASMSNRIDEWAIRETLDENTARKFKLKTEEFLNDGMTETQAWDAALAVANKSEDQVETKDGWFRDTETVTPGRYDGTFRDKPVEGLGPAPDRDARTPSQTPTPPSDPQTSAGQSSSRADILEAARDAIAKGADRNAVMTRLRENGIDPELL